MYNVEDLLWIEAQSHGQRVAVVVDWPLHGVVVLLEVLEGGKVGLGTCMSRNSSALPRMRATRRDRRRSSGNPGLMARRQKSTGKRRDKANLGISNNEEANRRLGIEVPHRDPEGPTRRTRRL